MFFTFSTQSRFVSNSKFVRLVSHKVRRCSWRAAYVTERSSCDTTDCRCRIPPISKCAYHDTCQPVAQLHYIRNRCLGGLAMMAMAMLQRLQACQQQWHSH